MKTAKKEWKRLYVETPINCNMESPPKPKTPLGETK
jgi:hypothetical protein